MRRALILQRVLPHYRIGFFERLREELAEGGVELDLVHGAGEGQGRLAWAREVPARRLFVGPVELVWQDTSGRLKGPDLVVAEHANRNLVNYAMMLKRRFSSQKLAFWGHGRDRTASRHDPRNVFKRVLARQCDWWFAYTGGVKQELVAQGFDANRITAVENAIDTRLLMRLAEGIPESAVEASKRQIGLHTPQVGIYCGRIYRDKRIPFLLEACDRIREQVPDFALIVLGDGPEADRVRAAAGSRQWVHYLGPRFGVEKATYFKMSKVLLMPGLVGLGLLDGFALATPMVTTRCSGHSPEIEYLQDGVSGLLTADDVDSYSAGVVRLLQDDDTLAAFRDAGLKAARRYTLENMVSNFAGGVRACLGVGDP